MDYLLERYDGGHWNVIGAYKDAAKAVAAYQNAIVADAKLCKYRIVLILACSTREE